MATRCCCPPESCAGRWPRRSLEADAPERFADRGARQPPAGEPRGERRRSARAVSAREQVERLEHEADALAPQPGELLARRGRGGRPPSKRTRPWVGRSSPAASCSSVDFPEPDGPHDRGEACRARRPARRRRARGPARRRARRRGRRRRARRRARRAVGASRGRSGESGETVHGSSLRGGVLPASAMPRRSHIGRRATPVVAARVHRPGPL